MSDFAVKTDNSNSAELLEVYTHDIFYYADEYINTVMDGEKDKKNIKDNFDNIILYIRHHIPKPNNDNIVLLDHLFDVFLELSIKCYVLPTLQNFALMLSINPNTFSAWKNREYRNATPEYSLAVKKWFDICKSRTENNLLQSEGGNINRIFASKVVYGMIEPAPAPVEYTRRLEPLTSSQVVARLGGETEDGDVIEG